MRASLKALLANLIDYAGLFPPAKLPLAEALDHYRRYRADADAWMLGRFVCPAARLQEIPEGVSLSCSAVGRGGATLAAFLEGLAADVDDIAQSPVLVEALETKLPAAVPADVGPCVDALRRALSRLPADLPVFFEAPAPESRRLLEALLLRAEDARWRFGSKLRAGGLEASAFPSSEEVAFAIRHARQHALPLKATAGLHHPFPRFDAAIGVRMHGFIPLFVAGVLGHAHTLTEKELCPILDDDDPSHFAFTDDGVRWGELSATTGQIVAARQEAIVSFGSCSFDEPRDDLRALGWL